MTHEELKKLLLEIKPTLVFDETGEWLNMEAGAEELPWIARQLKDHPDLLFDYLFCLTCVDWKTHLTMVYHLTSTRHRHTLVLKSRLDRENPRIETVCRIWKTADFHERETGELFGITFLNHPDPRKLILPDDFEGFPMRKDFEDPVNMIRL